MGHVSAPSQQQPCFSPKRPLTSLSDFADEFPDCKVIGTDVSPIQPSWIPPNLKL
jgi:hypothetical protein